jgi:hypothetical protein
MNNRSKFEEKAALMKQLHSPYESGQAIVIIALVMIVLLGMLGLAIDGGGLFFLQRDAQNATDAAVLSASYAICTKGSPQAAGLATMAQNGFNNNGVSNKVDIIYPPTAPAIAGNRNYVEVRLKAFKPAYFIQLVYSKPLQVDTYAVGNCIPPFDASSVGGLWAGSRTCENGMDWSGSDGQITGSIFSNYEVKIDNVTVHSGEIAAVDNEIQIPNPSKVTLDPGVTTATNVAPQADPLSLPIDLYAPGGDVAVMVPPGYYHAIPSKESTDFSNGKWSPNKGTIEGLYYVDGEVDVGIGVTVGVKGVTIVSPTGAINFSARNYDENKPVEYYDIVDNMTAKGVRYPGIIFYTNKVPSDSDPKKACGENGIVLSGSSIKIHGIAYAPYTGVNVSGSNLFFNGSIIANVINYSGSKGDFRYDESLLPPRPPSIQMVE